VDATAPDKRRLPPALVAGATAAVAAGLALAVVLLTSGSGSGTPPASPPTAPASPAARIAQAPWRIEAHAVGRFGDAPKAARRRLRAQRPRAAALVRDVYDAIVLRPRVARRTIRERFAPPAGRSFAGLRRLGPPQGASRVKTLVRRARVALEAPGGRRAVAAVSVRARGIARGRRFRLKHRSTLWLERSGGRWHVVAYEVDQRRR
jgi:hypothetical protein